MAKDEHSVKGPSEGPSGYNGSNAPDSKELGAPTKVYPGASKLGHDKGPKDLIEGPCTGKPGYGGYHK